MYIHICITLVCIYVHMCITLMCIYTYASNSYVHMYTYAWQSNAHMYKYVSHSYVYTYTYASHLHSRVHIYAHICITSPSRYDAYTHMRRVFIRFHLSHMNEDVMHMYTSASHLYYTHMLFTTHMHRIFIVHVQMRHVSRMNESCL